MPPALPWLYGSALVASVTEFGVACLRAPAGTFSIDRAAVALSSIQFFGFGVAVALALTALALAHIERAFRDAGLYDPEKRLSRRDFVAAAIVTAPFAVAFGGAIIGYFGRNFRNRELAAVLAATLVCSLAWAALVLTGVLGLVFRKARLRLAEAGWPAFVLWLPGASVVGALVFLDHRAHLIGASQLDSWLGAPVLGAALAALALRAPRVAERLARRSVQAALALVAVSLGAFAALSPVHAAAELGSYGAWSRAVVPLLRALTDFDGDGYSTWFAGGDCNDSDPAVHPGAVERPGNGIDENCLGGDGKLSPIEAPQPSGIRFFEPGDRTNVVLVTIETLRADRVSLLGYSRATTPRLAELATQSIVFERLYANTPTTRLSVPALLSGTLASRIDWQRQAPEKFMRRVGPRTPWLPEILRGEGYATLAVHANFRAFTQIESAGFDRGFDRYDVSTEVVYMGGTMHGFPGQGEVDRALVLLDATAKRPFFLWVHLLEPHYLYQQPPLAPHFGTTESDLYDAEIAEADRQVGRLLDGLSERGVLASSIVLVTGDHGEEFGEHGERWHTSNLYEPQVHTAGLLRIPGVDARRIRTPVVLTDFAPTLLDVLGKTAALPRMQGRNLAPLLRSGDRRLAPFFLENFRVSDGRAYQAAVVDWPYKLIRRDEGALVELYDVERDPGERDNLYLRDPEPAHALLGSLFRLRETRPVD